ncbi:MAG: hypothetical protein QM785_14625 [Pyrinomonadaceae bacterium]
MIKLILRTALVCACFGALAAGASGQAKKASDKNSGGSLAASVAAGTGKVAVVIVGSAAKSAWVTTKFVTKHAVWPVAKTALMTVPKQTAVLGLKTAGFSLKKGIPAAGKVGLAYLKTKLP